MDWTVKVTDIAIVIATFSGPFLAVYVTEKQRKKADARNRKVHIFRTLMATRAATLAATHIEALNLLDVEFSDHPEVLDRWRLYKGHLYDREYPPVHWPARRKELMVDLLHSMSVALGYSHAKADINSDAYYPSGYSDADLDQLRSRKLLLEVLEGKRQIPMLAQVYQAAERTETESSKTESGSPPEPKS